MVYDVYGREFPLEHMQACVGDGWADIVERLYRLCERHNIRVFQVKEKYGGLRFYVGEAPDIIHDAIEEAEKQSEQTCEFCGKEGKVIAKNGWLYCRCSDCMKK